MAFDDYNLIAGGSRRRKRLLSKAAKNRVAAKQGWKCAKCGRTLPEGFEVHHIKPFAEGGSDLESNLRAYCPNCHKHETVEAQAKKRRQMIREREGSRESGLFGGGNMLGGTLIRELQNPSGSQQPRQRRREKRSDNLLGGSLIQALQSPSGSRQPRQRKGRARSDSDNMLGGSLIKEMKKKKKKKEESGFASWLKS